MYRLFAGPFQRKHNIMCGSDGLCGPCTGFDIIPKSGFSSVLHHPPVRRIEGRILLAVVLSPVIGYFHEPGRGFSGCLHIYGGNPVLFISM